ncbi:MAG: FkbM family methyltransferase [Actinomycetota bacterium]|nr:FkbM family methyltransferase [Actinomycetota bacterium]
MGHLELPEVSSAAARRWIGRLARRSRGRCRVQVADGRVLTTNPDGRPLYLDGRDTSVTPSVLARGGYEPGSTRLLCRLTRTGARVLEIGANVGWHTLLMAERIGPAGRLVAFEPNPEAFDLLHLNVFVNGYWDRCRLEPVALSDHIGMASLHVAGSFLGSGRLRPFSPSDLAWQHQDERHFDVEVTTLDQAVADDPRFDLVKIDVEGAEPRVFAGAADLLAANPHLKLVMEFTPNQHGPEMLDWLRAAGFTLWSISRAGFTRPAVDRELLAEVSVDILATR